METDAIIQRVLLWTLIPQTILTAALSVEINHGLSDDVIAVEVGHRMVCHHGETAGSVLGAEGEYSE